jgi:hypothetical protein
MDDWSCIAGQVFLLQIRVITTRAKDRILISSSRRIRAAAKVVEEQETSLSLVVME